MDGLACERATRHLHDLYQVDLFKDRVVVLREPDLASRCRKLDSGEGANERCPVADLRASFAKSDQNGFCVCLPKLCVDIRYRPVLLLKGGHNISAPFGPLSRAGLR